MTHTTSSWLYGQDLIRNDENQTDKPMIKYVVESLGVSKLYIFYHYTLESFGFKQYCINTFKNIDFYICNF
jgi:hypothetical protein